MEEKPAVYEVTIKRRSFLGRLARVPGLLIWCYRVNRRFAGRVESLRAAWGMSTLILR
jgi:hypothetical protein